MRNVIRAISAAAAVLSVLIFSLIVFAARNIPDSITTVKNDIIIDSLYYASIEDGTVPAVSDAGKSISGIQTDASFRMFGILPVKTVSVTKTDRKYVVPGGSIVGIRLQADGVMIVAIQPFDSDSGQVSPAADAGLLKGDIIRSINGKAISDNASLVSAIDSNGEKTAAFTVLRGGEYITLNVKPQRAVQNDRYKCGLWVRDSAAGIGTLSFYCPDSGMFACLGHSVTDADTGLPVPLSDGELLSAGIIGVKKGSSGTAGELSGVLGGEILGELLLNNSTGVYGKLNNIPAGEPIALACCAEVHEGDAKIITSIDSNPPKMYDAKIISVDSKLNNKEKNFVIEVTDTALLSVTGGIVQGMSGSPVIQDGMLAGVVTHVFLNNSKCGYGIFAEHMYASALQASQSSGRYRFINEAA